MTITTEQAQAVFNDVADEGHGFGYIGGRRAALDSSDPECPAQPEAVAATDAAILAIANTKGWTTDDLFAWADSKNGRWYCDSVFGRGGADLDAAIARAASLVVLPR